MGRTRLHAGWSRRGERPRPPGAAGGWDTGGMPVLEPNPKNGQKMLVTILGAMLAITVVIGVIATLAAP